MEGVFVMKKRSIAAGVLLAAFLTLITYLGIFYRFDRWAADGLYQSPRLTAGNVLVVGIDERALTELGPFHRCGRI